jgi:hypothetical protein
MKAYTAAERGAQRAWTDETLETIQKGAMRAREEKQAPISRELNFRGVSPQNIRA